MFSKVCKLSGYVELLMDRAVRFRCRLFVLNVRGSQLIAPISPLTSIAGDSSHLHTPVGNFKQGSCFLSEKCCW